MKKKAEKVTNHPALGDPASMPAGFAADPQGSYTGIPADPFEKPVQDADDL